MTMPILDSRFLRCGVRVVVITAAIGAIGCGTYEKPASVPPPPGSDEISNQAWSGAGRDASWEGGKPFGMPTSH